MRRSVIALVVVALTCGVLVPWTAPPAVADAGPYQLSGTVEFVDQATGTPQKFVVDVLATGSPYFAGTGSVQWVTGLHPGTYTDIVKVDVDTTTVPGTTVSTVVFRIGTAEWAITVSDPGNGGTLAAKLYDLSGSPPLAAQGNVTSGGLQTTPGTGTGGPGDPAVTSFAPVSVLPGGSVTFSGDCGTRPAPQALTVNLLNVANQGYYAGQQSIPLSFAPGSNSGAYTPFSGSFPVAPGVSGYTLTFIVTCFWPAPPYPDNTQGNQWFAVTTDAYSVKVVKAVKVAKPKWGTWTAQLAHGALATAAAPWAVQVATFGGSFGPPAPTTTTSTTTTTTTTAPPTSVPLTAPPTAPPETSAPTTPTTVCVPTPARGCP
jgi:hypothetical protein